MLALLAVTARAQGLNQSSPAWNSTGTCRLCQKISANQVAKNPRPVELLGRGKGTIMGMSESEWEDRLSLAALGRIMYMYGFGSDLAAQCLMARVRDDPDTMLLNEWGFYFEETTASSLVKVRFGAGTPAEGTYVGPGGVERPSTPDLVNIGCVPVGRAILNARPDVNTIIHAHPYPVMAVGATEAGLLPLSQAAFFLHGQIGRYKYDFSYAEEFETAIAEQFASGKRAIILNHHGLYAVGADARDAWFVTFHLRQACEVQLLAQSTGAKLLIPDKQELQKQYDDMITSTDYAYDGSREWAGCVRKLNRELPGYEA